MQIQTPDSSLCPPTEKFISKPRETNCVHILQIFVQILNSYPIINAPKFTRFHKQLQGTDFMIHVLFNSGHIEMGL